MLQQWLTAFFMCIFLSLEAAHFENFVDLTIKVEDQGYNLRVNSVKFNGQEIKLDEPDLLKPRKETQFRLQPGRYNLTWSTLKGLPKWSEEIPRVHEKILVLESGDSIVRVNIKGDSINLY